MIYQKLADNTLVPFTEGKVTDGTNTVSISNGTARVWAKTDEAHLNKWNLYNPKIVIVKPEAFDRKTELLIGPTDIVSTTAITRTYTKRNKTTKEVGDEKAGEVDEMPNIVFLALLDMENRVRNSTGKTAAAKAPLNRVKMMAKLKALLL